MIEESAKFLFEIAWKCDPCHLLFHQCCHILYHSTWKDYGMNFGAHKNVPREEMYISKELLASNVLWVETTFGTWKWTFLKSAMAPFFRHEGPQLK
jgi:hypothetical protein